MSGVYVNSNDLKLKKIGRSKKVYFTSDNWYFLWNGKRVKSDEILRLAYPIMFNDKDGKLTVISGYINISNCYSVMVSLDSDSETVQLYYDFEE